MRSRLISFDLDKTLVFQNPKIKYEALREIFIRLGCDVSTDTLLNAINISNHFYESKGYTFASTPDKLWHEYINVMTSVLGFQGEEVIQDVYNYYQTYNCLRTNFIVPQAAKDLLYILKEAGVLLAIVSSNVEAEKRLSLCELENLFDYIFSPSMGFPKTELFHVMLDTANIQPSRCTHVGDDPILDVLAPSKYQIEAILFDPDFKHTAEANHKTCRTYNELQMLLLKSIST